MHATYYFPKLFNCPCLPRSDLTSLCRRASARNTGLRVLVLIDLSKANTPLHKWHMVKLDDINDRCYSANKDKKYSDIDLKESRI